MGYISFLRENFRWLAAAILLTFSSSYGQTFFISLFAGEIRAEFGLSHGAWGGIYTIGTSLSAIAMIWGGTLTDRFRVRALGPVILVLLGIACLAMAAVQSAWMLIPVIFALRFSGQGMTSHIAMVATARWFIATRGQAMSIASLGILVGTAILPLIFVALLDVFNWRILWILAAGMAWFMIPVLRHLLQYERTPRSISKGDESTGMGGIHWRRSQLLRHWLFWLMIPSLLGPAAWGTALFFQQVHIAQVKGWEHLEFVALFPLYIGVTIITTFAIGWAIDKFGTNRILPFYMIPFIGGFLTLGWTQSLTGAAFALMLLGVGAGVGNTLPGAFWAEHCGTRYLGSIKAMAAAVMVFGSAIGPGVSGWLIDKGIDFPDQTLGIAIYFAIAAGFSTVASLKARPLLAIAP